MKLERAATAKNSWLRRSISTSDPPAARVRNASIGQVIVRSWRSRWKPRQYRQVRRQRTSRPLPSTRLICITFGRLGPSSRLPASVQPDLPVLTRSPVQDRTSFPRSHDNPKARLVLSSAPLYRSLLSSVNKLSIIAVCRHNGSREWLAAPCTGEAALPPSPVRRGEDARCRPWWEWPCRHVLG